MPPRRRPANAQARSRSRQRYVWWVARKPGETKEEHELRLMEFFLYIIGSEALRLRVDLSLEAHARAQRLREALMAMLVPPMDETPGGAVALDAAAASGFAGHPAKRV